MKKIKLLTPIISGASLAAIAPAMIAAGVGAAKKAENVSVKKSEKSNDIKKPIEIDIADTSISARKYMKSDDTSVTWKDKSGTITSPTAADSKLQSIGNSAFAFSNLETITIPGTVTAIDPMAFFHCDKLKEIDVSLVQKSLLNVSNPDGGFNLGSYAFREAGPTVDETAGSYVFEKYDSTGVKTPASKKEYNMQMAYIKALLTYTGANTKWPIKTKTDVAGKTQDAGIMFNALPVQYMKFETTGEDKGKLKGFDTSALTENSSYNTVIFPSWMTGMTDDGLTAWDKVKETNVIKNVFFLSPADESDETGVTAIPKEWFRGWQTLEWVILPSSVTAIESGAFANCNNLKTLDMENVTMTSLPGELCENAGKDVTTGLEIKYPQGLTQIGEDAFSGAGIKTLDLPVGLTNINDSAFENCNTLEKVIIPNNISAVGQAAFAGCPNLETVVFDETSNAARLVTICDSAFDDCPKLKTVANSRTYTEGTFTLPASLGKSDATNDDFVVGTNAFAYTGSETPSSKGVNTFQVIDFSNIPAEKAVNITFDEDAFAGWPTKGKIIGALDWTDDTWETVLQNLQDGGLSKRWVKLTADTTNVLNVVYDEGTKLAINPGTFAEEHAPDIEYSYTANSTDWHTITTGTVLELSKDYSTIYLRGTNPDGFNIPHTEGTGFQQKGVLQFTNSTAGKGVSISGNVMGLIDAGAGTSTTIPTKQCFQELFFGSTAIQNISTGFLGNCNTLTENCYASMFMGCENMKTAPKLPATNLAKNCYYDMFRNSGIETMPKLSATTLKESCYEGMFQGCTGLKTVVDLPSTPTLAEHCFKNMFYGCATMNTAPKLPQTDDQATTKVSPLVKGCYEGMFRECKALNVAPELSAKLIPQDAYKNMFTGCESLQESPKILVPTDSDKYSFGTSCYEEMFKDCTSLKKITVKFTEWPTDTSTAATTTNWVKNVAPSGTFVCPNALPHSPLQDGYWNDHQIPYNWGVDPEDKPIDPYDPEDTNTEMYVTCKEATEVTLLNYGTNALATSNPKSTRPDLRVMIKDSTGKQTMDWTSIYDGDATGTFGKQGSPTTFTIPAGGYCYFKGVNPNGWSHAPSSGSGWTDNYSSIWFSRPDCKIDGYKRGRKDNQDCYFEKYIDSKTNKAPTSTGVKVFGNIMSLILNSSTGGVDSYKPELSELPAWCFASLFRGRTYLNDNNGNVTSIADDATESASCNYYQHNYCIESVVDTFLSVVSIGEASLAKTFAVCPNLTTGADVWSRLPAGQRTTKKKAFGDTYQGCASLITPPDYNLDCIDSEADAKDAFHGTLIDCWQMTRTPHIKITDLSMLAEDADIWGYAYYQDYMISEVYCYADMNETQLANYTKEKHKSAFYAWLGGNAGKNVGSSTVKKVYMAPNFYKWICDNFNDVETKTETPWIWDTGHGPQPGDPYPRSMKGIDWQYKKDEWGWETREKEYIYNESGTNKNGHWGETETTTTIKYYAYGDYDDSELLGQLPASADNQWPVYNIYKQDEELVWTPTGLLFK